MSSGESSEHDNDNILDAPDQESDESAANQISNWLLFILLSAANLLILYSAFQFNIGALELFGLIGIGVEIILLFTIVIRKN